MSQTLPEACPETSKNTAQPGASAPNPFQSMMQMITGFWTSSCIYAVASLGVPDLLQSGPKGVEELAEQTGANADYLYRVMRALSGLDIFHELPGKRFEQTPFSALLVKDAPGSLHCFAVMMGDEHYQAWGHLLKSMKKGDRPFEAVFGMPVFEYFQKNPQAGEIFNGAMTSFASNVHNTALSVYDFSSFHTLVDVGGGHGALLSAILRQYPKLKGVLFDLPHVIAGAKIPAELSNRLTTASGDFFQAVHPGADAYILSTVIHDWSDELAVKILRNIHAAMPEQGGTLLLVENVVAADNQPSFGKFLDINMLVMTEGGRERTREEYAALYQQAGFELTRVVAAPSGFSVVEGRKR